MAIDTSETKNSLFGSFRKPAKQTSPADLCSSQKEEIQGNNTDIKEKIKQEDPLYTTEEVAIQPKWQTFDKVTALLTSEQKEGLDRVAKKLMKFRSKALKGENEKERITANTLMRALINKFLQMEELTQMEILSSEEDVRAWIGKMFKN